MESIANLVRSGVLYVRSGLHGVSPLDPRSHLKLALVAALLWDRTSTRGDPELICSGAARIESLHTHCADIHGNLLQFDFSDLPSWATVSQELVRDVGMQGHHMGDGHGAPHVLENWGQLHFFYDDGSGQGRLDSYNRSLASWIPLSSISSPSLAEMISVKRHPEAIFLLTRSGTLYECLSQRNQRQCAPANLEGGQGTIRAFAVHPSQSMVAVTTASGLNTQDWRLKIFDMADRYKRLSETSMSRGELPAGICGNCMDMDHSGRVALGLQSGWVLWGGGSMKYQELSGGVDSLAFHKGRVYTYTSGVESQFDGASRQLLSGPQSRWTPSEVLVKLVSRGSELFAQLRSGGGQRLFAVESNRSVVEIGEPFSFDTWAHNLTVVTSSRVKNFELNATRLNYGWYPPAWWPRTTLSYVVSNGHQATGVLIDLSWSLRAWIALFLAGFKLTELASPLWGRVFRYVEEVVEEQNRRQRRVDSAIDFASGAFRYLSGSRTPDPVNPRAARAPTPTRRDEGDSIQGDRDHYQLLRRIDRETAEEVRRKTGLVVQIAAGASADGETPLGEGADGTFDVARVVSSGYIVGVKISPDSGDRGIYSAVRDAEHVVPLIEEFTREGRRYQVLGVAGLGDAQKLMNRLQRVPFSVRERLLFVVAEGLLKALKVLHEREVTHRDIKPDNILLDRSGEVLLGDFGRSEVQRGPSGCAYYAAPEQRSGKFKQDLWSAGLTLLEIATGESLASAASAFRSQEGLDEWVQRVMPKGAAADSFWALAESLLAFAPDRRPSATDALQNPWMVRMKRQLRHRSNVLMSIRDLMLPTRSRSPRDLPFVHESRARRTELKKQIADALQPGERVTLHGPLGSGKTTLAAAIVRRDDIESRFPRRYWIGPGSPAEVIDQLRGVLDEIPGSASASAAASGLDQPGEETLIVFDGVEVPHIPNRCAVLITAPEPGEGANIPVEMLEPEEVSRWLADEFQPEGDWVHALEGHSFGLRLGLAYCQQFGEEPTISAAGAAAGAAPFPSPVVELFRQVYERLSRDSQQLLRQLSRGPLPSLDPGSELVQLGLVYEDGDHGWRLHRSTRELLSSDAGAGAL